MEHNNVEIISRYQAMIAARDRELAQLRGLRHVVLAFLDRHASFAELRQAVNAKEQPRE